MARINLLPWRENLRAQRQRDFGVMLVIGVLLTVFAMGYWHWFNESLVDHQKRRNQFLENEIASVQKQIKEIRNLEKTRKQLISRMDVVTNLQSSRPQIVHLFDELVTSLPEGVYLTQATQNGRNVVVSGSAQSNARVSAYMRGIEASPWLQMPNLRIIEHKGKQSEGANTFELNMQQMVPKAEGAQ